MKKNSKNITIILINCTLLVLCIIYSNQFFKEFIHYSNLFLEKVFPSTFTLLIISNILLDYQIIHYIQILFKNKSPYIYLLIMSMISGFPSGTIYIKEMLEKKIISKEMANQMIQYASFPNPLFLINISSIVLNSKILSIKLLFSIFISNILIFIKIPKENYIITNQIENINFTNSLKTSISKAINSIILIYGSSIFFSLIAFFLTKIISNNIYSYVLINGIFDLTKGITSSSILPNTTLKYYFILLLISLNPITIHMQTKSILEDTSISYKKYLTGRITSTILSFIISILIIR
ncbi:MAG: hypothetical protein IJG68_04475 [Bacilli bacterium]|nr:hypothetical protein [Bacilli bacterium]